MDNYLTKQKPEEITDFFFKITNDFSTSIEKVKTNNSVLDITNDSRIVVFTTLREVANSSLLSSVFLKDYLTKKEWWKNNKNFSLPSTELESYAEARIYSYGVDLSTNYIILSFTHFENSLRSIVKAIPNSKFPDALEDFWRIRDYLIDYAAINSDYKNLIKIFQTIRNSNHNGGFHTKDDMTVTYKSQIFTFEKFKPIKFDLWSTIEFIMTELNQFLFDLVTAPKINRIHFIQHPFGTINFIKK